MINIKYWIYAARPKTLIASIAPIMPVSILCIKNNVFNLPILIIIIFAALCIQIMTNFINDLYDYKRGADTFDRVGPERMLQMGYLTSKQMKKGIAVVFALALLSGAYLVDRGGYPILLIGLSGFLFAYLYTATKISIAYNGLGEIFVFLYFGIISSLGTYYLFTLQYSKNALLIGSIAGALNILLLVVNNLRDYETDMKAKKNTLIVLMGENFGKIEFVIISILIYLFLYFLLVGLNQVEDFLWFIPLIIFALLLCYRVIYKIKFMATGALQQISLYITLFTLLLSTIIYL
tara:strand:+ start:3155 stop:4030 length:876 start_codon:yes stop_codon:yes gene_type:complete